jgi:thiamine biosynthesis lipoprotein
VQSKRSNPKQKPELRPGLSHEWSFEAIGTHWWIGIFSPLEARAITELQDRVAIRIEAFDSVYSRFRSDSLVSKVAERLGAYHFPPDSAALFAHYRSLYDATNGLVTPLIGSVLSDAGYDSSYSLVSKQLREPPKWDEALRFEGTTLHVKQAVLLDFGAAGKGYLVDLVAQELRDCGVLEYCIDAGGDMACHGMGTPLRVGLENPDDLSEVVGVAELTEGALCGSAGNRRTWQNFTHVMDPKKLASPRHIKAVWAYATDTLTADGLTTALYFQDAEALRTQFEFEHCMIYADGSVSVSHGFPAKLFTKSNEQ